MTTRVNTPARLTVSHPEIKPVAGLWQVLPRTTEEHVQCIAAIGQRINGYIQFMCAAGESIAALPRKTSRSPTRSGSQTGAHVLPCPTCGGSGELPSAQEDERKKVAVLQHPEVETLATAKPPAMMVDALAE